MFRIELHESLQADAALLAEKGVTLETALTFIDSLSCGDGILVQDWTEFGGEWSMDVYNYWDCFTTNPPRFARIIAPAGFIPPAGAEPRSPI